MEENILGRAGDGAGFDFTGSDVGDSAVVTVDAVFFDVAVKNGCVSFFFWISSVFFALVL